MTTARGPVSVNKTLTFGLLAVGEGGFALGALEGQRDSVVAYEHLRLVFDTPIAPGSEQDHQFALGPVALHEPVGFLHLV